MVYTLLGFYCYAGPAPCTEQNIQPKSINVKNFTLCCYLLFEAIDAILINIYLLINCVSLAYLYPFPKCLYNMFPAVMVFAFLLQGVACSIHWPLTACSQTHLESIK